MTPKLSGALKWKVEEQGRGFLLLCPWLPGQWKVSLSPLGTFVIQMSRDIHSPICSYG